MKQPSNLPPGVTDSMVEDNVGPSGPTVLYVGLVRAVQYSLFTQAQADAISDLVCFHIGSDVPDVKKAFQELMEPSK